MWLPKWSAELIRYENLIRLAPLDTLNTGVCFLGGVSFKHDNGFSVTVSIYLEPVAQVVPVSCMGTTLVKDISCLQFSFSTRNVPIVKANTNPLNGSSHNTD